MIMVMMANKLEDCCCVPLPPRQIWRGNHLKNNADEAFLETLHV